MRPRVYLDKYQHIGSWKDIRPYLSELKSRDVEDANGLERLLRDFSELEKAVNEEYAIKSIMHSRHFNDPERLDEFKKFNDVYLKYKSESVFVVDKIKSSEYFDRLVRERPEIAAMERVTNEIESNERVESLIKSAENSFEKYNSLFGGLSIEDPRGEGRVGYNQVKSILKGHSDSTVREKAWKSLYEEISKFKNEIGESYVLDVVLLNGASEAAGFKNYNEFVQAIKKRQYSQEDLRGFHDAVSNSAPPVLKEYAGCKAKALGLDSLRPWDYKFLCFDEPVGREMDETEMIDAVTTVLRGIDVDLADAFVCENHMRGLNDIENREGKSFGSYTMSLPETGSAFMFVNANLNTGNLNQLMHEAGHVLHDIVNADSKYYFYNKYSSESSELVAMCFELMTLSHLEAVMDCKTARVYRINQFERVMKIIPWAASVDKFQHAVYADPNLKRLDPVWSLIYEQMHGRALDWSGLDAEKGMQWMEQMHVFSDPHYYVEYALAMAAAVRFLMLYESQPEEALNKLKKIMSDSKSEQDEALYAEIGASLIPDENEISEVMKYALSKWKEEMTR